MSHRDDDVIEFDPLEFVDPSSDLALVDVRVKFHVWLYAPIIDGWRPDDASDTTLSATYRISREAVDGLVGRSFHDDVLDFRIIAAEIIDDDEVDIARVVIQREPEPPEVVQVPVIRDSLVDRRLN